MKNKTLKITSLLLILCGLTFVSPASAGPNQRSLRKRAAKQMRRINKAQSRLNRILNRLSGSSMALVALRTSDRYADSDDDGIPDWMEDSNGTDLCDSDSDDDGHNDGDELDDSLEVEVKGTISALSDSNLTVAGQNFLLTDSTVYEDVTQDALSIGMCIEAKGYINAQGKLPASEIELENDC